MLLSAREGWVGAEYDLRNYTSEMLSVFFVMELDENTAHEVLEGVEGWVLNALEPHLVAQILGDSGVDSCVA